MRKHLRLALIAPVVLALTACSAGSGDGVTLPSRFRLSSSQTSSFFEQKVGRIAITRSDGNLIVVDQTGERPIEITRDAQSRMLRDRSGAIRDVYRLPVWSPDGTQLAVVESRYAFPLTSTVIVQGLAGVQAAVGPGSRVTEQTLNGSVTNEASEQGVLTYEPSRITIEFGGSHVRSALYTVVPDGKSAMKEIFSSEEVLDYVDWSPQGDQLALGTIGQNGKTLTTMTPEGANKQAIANAPDLNWSWSPQGYSMLVQSRLDASNMRANIAVIDSETGDEIARVGSRVDTSSIHTQFSPDGNFMVTTEPGENGEFNLILADKDGKRVRSLRTVSGLLNYAWSPTGAKLAFVVRETAASQGGPLRLLDVNSGQLTLLSAQPVAGFFWSPNGNYIAAVTVADTGSMDPQVVADLPNGLSDSAQNPMMMQTINVNTREARPTLLFEPTDAFLQVVLNSNVYARSMTIWSPNSRRMVVPLLFRGNGGGEAIVEMESSGSIWPRIIGQGEMAVWSPR
jgi:Tol biopolymer transport system component